MYWKSKITKVITVTPQPTEYNVLPTYSLTKNYKIYYSIQCFSVLFWLHSSVTSLFFKCTQVIRASRAIILRENSSNRLSRRVLWRVSNIDHSSSIIFYLTAALCSRHVCSHFVCSSDNKNRCPISASQPMNNFIKY